MGGPTLLLASASPRRRDLIARLGLEAAGIAAADIDETPLTGEDPRVYARRMAREKALAAASDTHHVLAGDTVVALGRRILPKAEDEQVARRCLQLISGRRHHVLSAIALRAPDGTVRERLSDTMVQVKRLTTGEIDAYLAGGEWHGKAGGYAIQGAFEGLVKRIDGSHSGVMGLPLYDTRALLVAAGFALG